MACGVKVEREYGGGKVQVREGDEEESRERKQQCRALLEKAVREPTAYHAD